MKTIKKLKKSTKAVAGSALLVGATLAGGASMALAQDSGSSGDSYDLGSYPNQPFVDEDGNLASSVIVGEDAKPVDIVAGIDIAGQLGNNAYSEEETVVEGSETTEVNGNAVDVDLLDGNLETTVTATDFDELVRNHEYGESDNRVTESVDVTSNAGVAVDDEAQPRTTVPRGSVNYIANYPGGVEQGETLYVLGNEYEVTEAGPSELQLGSTKTTRNLATGDTVEHGPYTVEITDNDGEDTVYLTIMQDGETLAQETFTPGEDSQSQSFGPNDEFNVNATSVFFGNEERVTLETTYTDTVVEDGEVSPWDEDYDVDYSYDNGVENLTLSNNVAYTQMDLAEDEELEEGQGLALAPGESLEGPNELFQVENLGLTEEATEEVDFSEDYVVSYTDANGFAQKLNLVEDLHDPSTSVSEGDKGHVIVESSNGNVPVYFSVDNVETSGSPQDVEVTFEYGGYEETATFDNEGSTKQTATNSGYGFTMAVDNVGDSDGNLQIDTAAETLPSSLETDFNGELNAHQYTQGGEGWTTEGASTASLEIDSVTEIGFEFDDLNSEQVDITITVDGTDYTATRTLSSGNTNVTEADFGTDGLSDPYTIDNVDVALSGSGSLNSPNQVTVTEGGTTGQDSATWDSFNEVSGAGNYPAQGLYQASSGSTDIIGLAENREGTGTSVLATSYDDNNNQEISSVIEVSDNFNLTDTEDGEQTLSGYGSHVELVSEESATVAHPQNERHAAHAVGETTTTAGEDQTYTERTPTGVSDVATLDTDSDAEARTENENVVLVGGPLVNDMTKTLAENNETWTADEYTDGQGLLQYVPDAFADGYDALLVSGQSGEDTRAAADFLTNYEENADDLEGSTQLSISTETGEVAE
jgi:hypothetical protein